MSGYLTYFGLDDWFNSTFTKEQRKYISEKSRIYNKNFDIGYIQLTTMSKESFVSTEAQYFKTKKDIQIAIKFLEQSDSDTAKNTMTAMDYHYFCMNRIEVYYKDRENKESFDKSIYFCNEMIRVSKQAYKEIKQFEKDLYADCTKEELAELPKELLQATATGRHLGFEQLVIIEKKNKNYKRVIELAEQAKLGKWGTPENWNRYIDFANAKLCMK